MIAFCFSLFVQTLAYPVKKLLDCVEPLIRNGQNRMNMVPRMVEQKQFAAHSMNTQLCGEIMDSV